MRGLHGEVRAADFGDGVVAADGAALEGARVVRMEGEIGRPGLVGIEEKPGLFAEAADFPDGIEDAFVGAGGDDEHLRAPGLRESRGTVELGAQVVQVHGPPDAEAGVEAGGQIARHGAGHDHCVVHRLVAITVEEHHFAGAQKGHQHGLVGGAGAVGDEATLRGAEDFRGQALGLRERRVALGVGEVSQRFHRDGEIRAEDHGGESVVEAVEEGGTLEGVAVVVARGVPGGAGAAADVLTQGVPEAGQPEGREEVPQAFAVAHGVGQHGERFLRPTAAGQVELGVAGARDEHLGDGGEVGQKPRGDGETVDGVVEERPPAQLVVQQKEATPAPGLREDMAVVLRAEKCGVQLLRRAHGHQPQARII